MHSIPCHRRTFLQQGGAMVAFVMLWPFRRVSSLLHADPVRQPVETMEEQHGGVGMDPVAAVPCDSYENEQVFSAVQKALAAIGFTVPHGVRVLLKPNIIAQNTPDQAATTHPAVVEALCRIFTSAGCTVTIGDSSAFYQSGGTGRGMETTGMSAVAARCGARILPFEKAPIRKITSGKTLNPFWITEAVFDHDLVVNVPKLKVHQLARYTGAIKNLYGCIPGGTKQTYHERFQSRPDYKEFWGRPIVDVYDAVRPGLTVMDAVYGLDKDGPAATGVPRKTGMLLASVNGAQLDVAACRMIGFDPRWVPAVRVALQRGLADETSLRVIGSLPLVPYVKIPDKKPSKTGDYLFHQVIMKPVVMRGRCKEGCNACIGICKPGAISVDKKNRPEINLEWCIRCYCCAEQCPQSAIRLRGGVLNHTIRVVRKIMKI